MDPLRYIASSAWSRVVDSMSNALDQGADHTRTIALTVGALTILYIILRINLKIAHAILRDNKR